MYYAFACNIIWMEICLLV